MIVTDRFVYLAYPRTGTTFVRNALKRLYGVHGGRLRRILDAGRAGRRGRFREHILPMTHSTSARAEGRVSQHGGASRIPDEARGLPVFATMRNPFDLIVSAYEHRFWREHPVDDVDDLRRKYPTYPDLGFEEYVAMMHDEGVRDLLDGEAMTASIGHVTLRFLKFFAREPERVLDALTDDAIDRDDIAERLAEVRFVHTENLVQELRAFLATVGIGERRTRFLLDLPRANVAEDRGGRPWQEYYTPALRARVRHAERFLFRLFPQYDV